MASRKLAGDLTTGTKTRINYMIKAAVVILNWNGRKFLEQFIPKVVAYNPAYSEIIIADNCSTDDSVEWMTNHFPQIKIIKNASNGGFAKGYNEALSQLDAEYFVLLNSDVEVTDNWMDPIITLMDNDLTIAACQPKIRSYNEREKFEYAGAAGGFIDKWGFTFVEEEYLTPMKMIWVNTTIHEKFFGLLVPVYLFVQVRGKKLVALTKTSLLIWKRSICVGAYAIKNGK